MECMSWLHVITYCPYAIVPTLIAARFNLVWLMMSVIVHFVDSLAAWLSLTLLAFVLGVSSLMGFYWALFMFRLSLGLNKNYPSTSLVAFISHLPNRWWGLMEVMYMFLHDLLPNLGLLLQIYFHKLYSTICFHFEPVKIIFLECNPILKGIRSKFLWEAFEELST